MYFRLSVSIILTGVLVFIISRFINIQDLPQMILSFPKDQLIVLITISISISILKSWRFLLLLRNSNIELTFMKNLKAFMASQAISPLPGGESMRGILIHKETGTDLQKTTGPVITQAYLEMLSGAIFALIGSLVFSSLRIPVLIFLFLLISLGFILNSHRALQFLRSKLNKLKILHPALDLLLKTQKNITSHFIDKETHLPDKILVRALSLSLLSTLFGGVLLLLIAKNYGVDLNIFQATFVTSASIIIQSLSFFSPAGIGPTEGGMSALLLTYNVPLSQAIAIIILYRLMTLFLNVIIGLLLLVIFYSRTLIFRKTH